MKPQNDITGKYKKPMPSEKAKQRNSRTVHKTIQKQPAKGTSPKTKAGVHARYPVQEPASSKITASQFFIIFLMSLVILGLIALIILFFQPGQVRILEGNDTETAQIKRLESTDSPEVAVPVPEAIEPPPPEKEPENTGQMREIRIYFVKVNTEGLISLKSVNRMVDFAQSPLSQSINALINGPGSDEMNKGSLSLIPEDSRLLSARVEGSTAFLNFNEAFRFNPLGREGYLAQLKQIVYTSTEFSNIDQVQILIEGVVREYLGGEGFYIGSPLNRESFQNIQ